MADKRARVKRARRLVQLQSAQYSLEALRLQSLTREQLLVQERQQELLFKMAAHGEDPLSGSAQLARMLSSLSRRNEALDFALGIQKPIVSRSRLAVEAATRRSEEMLAELKEDQHEQVTQNAIESALLQARLPKA